MSDHIILVEFATVKIHNALGLFILYQYFNACYNDLLRPIMDKFARMTIDDIVHNIQKWSKTWRHTQRIPFSPAGASSTITPSSSVGNSPTLPEAKRQHLDASVTLKDGQSTSGGQRGRRASVPRYRRASLSSQV